MGEEDSRYQLSGRGKRELAFGEERPATEKQQEVSGNRGAEEFERITETPDNAEERREKSPEKDRRICSVG
jgi:hypothetical protein